MNSNLMQLHRFDIKNYLSWFNVQRSWFGVPIPMVHFISKSSSGNWIRFFSLFSIHFLPHPISFTQNNAIFIVSIPSENVYDFGKGKKKKKKINYLLVYFDRLSFYYCTEIINYCGQICMMMKSLRWVHSPHAKNLTI